MKNRSEAQSRKITFLLPLYLRFKATKARKFIR
jgi:hypothetical protein